ncbi:CopG family transcriptional regulator [Achromatium sp. WMS3]|nr:CopG family transcriptional regulator [Achromatium sp. WMS3]
MTTSINLSPDIERRLDTLAAKIGKTKAFCLHTVIKQGLNDIEDGYSAAAILNRVQKGEEKVYSSEMVRKELGLDY